MFTRLFPNLQQLPQFARPLLVATALALAALTPAAAQTVVPGTIAAGTNPRTPALNPVTGKVYVPNRVGGVTVIDGANNNSTSTIAAGTSPIAVAVNPVTNKIYVANSGSNNVTIIDGAAGTTTTVAVGTTPFAIAVDTRNNRVYVANSDSANVSVIDGGTGTVSATVPAGSGPRAIGINAATNRIYVANGLAATVTVIDGSNLATTTVNVSPTPGAIAVNPVTNTIYVASLGSNSIDVIDGATNTKTSINPGPIPTAIAVNPATNRVYVACGAANSVAMIDVDAGNTVTSIPVGASPRGISIDATTNLIYVTNNTGNSVSVIRGRDNTVSTLAVGTGPNGIAANPLSNQIYVMNQNSNNVSVIDGRVPVSVNVGLSRIPGKIAINEVTNKIYVETNGVLTVIDGATNQTTVVNTPATGVVVNPNTNKIYVGANYGFGVYLRVIDGDTLQVRDINFPANGFINDLAINPVTNRIYAVTVASGPGPATGKLLIFDGDTESLFGVIPVGNNPVTVLANPANNLVYIANNASNSMTIIDGANIGNQSTLGGLNSPWFMALNPANNAIFISSRVGNLVTMLTNIRQDNNTVVNPDSIAVNPVTNRAYVVNLGTANTVTVLNGVNNSVITTINVGAVPRSVAVNAATNKIYVGTAGGFVAIIDGATNTFVTVPSGISSAYAAVNSVTGRAYIANGGSNNVTVIGGPAYNKHAPVFSMNGGSVTGFSNPLISVSITGAWTPNDPPVNKLYYRLGTTGPYSLATGTGPFNIALSGLTVGSYTVQAFATDDMQGTSMSTGGVDSGGTGSMIGTPGTFKFSVVTPTIQLETIKSRQTHAVLGDCDIDIDKNVAAIGGAVSVEPRTLTPTQRVVFNFNENVNNAGSALVTDASGNPVGNAPSVSKSGKSVIVTANGITDNQRVRVALNGVNAGINVNAYLGYMLGDVGSTRAITAADISALKARNGQMLDAGNCRFDVNLSGSIDGADLSAVRARSGQVLP